MSLKVWSLHFSRGDSVFVRLNIGNGIKLPVQNRKNTVTRLKVYLQFLQRS